MKRILITGTSSYIGTNVERWLKTNDSMSVDSLDVKSDAWRDTDFSGYDSVYHVAGIAHVSTNPKLKDLYYKVNRDLTIEVARKAKMEGVGQFIFMSSMIVFHESQTLNSEVVTRNSTPNPNDFYGDSKLQAEKGLLSLESPDFRICILRPPMVYGPGSKGNFPRLVKLAQVCPCFPEWHNRRSMIYIDNLCEFVRQTILHELAGTYYPQNKEYSDTTEIIRFFAKAKRHRIFISKIFNPLVWMAGKFLRPVCKMFSTYHYDSEMSRMDFNYQLVSLEESLSIIAQKQ